MQVVNLFLLIGLIASASAAYDEYFKESSDDRRMMPGYEIKREDIVKNMEKRREQLSKMLKETQEQLADHDAGRKLIEDEEHKRLSKRVGILEKKLERMVDIDENEIDRMHRRDERRYSRRRERSREL
eukprot:CAMPEP_0194132960 /NCGR_PEP_ID=MMETSP0152-20130528/3298_1 /TAXON_ID=1049557 /ORGANISM="Thalassiothrix antarctica, Strain L6-D1" /LENGTH=127 /DNA_ID=CAMNT_0038828167 /DNA_START=60 /DNA_END=443 /DNA_ORIENTATION=+